MRKSETSPARRHRLVVGRAPGNARKSGHYQCQAIPGALKTARPGAGLSDLLDGVFRAYKRPCLSWELC